MGSLNSWDVVDAGNNAAPPDGWPENTMQYSEVNDTGRAVQGTLKRWFSDNNGTLVAGGVADAYTVTLNESDYTSYFDGLTFRCSIPFENLTTTPTIDVNGVGPALITDNEGLPISVSNFLSGGIYDFQYDGTNFRVGGGALGSSSAAGNDTELQFNDNGLLGGMSEFTYNDAQGQLTVTDGNILMTESALGVGDYVLDIDIDGVMPSVGGGLRILGGTSGGSSFASLLTVSSSTETLPAEFLTGDVNTPALKLYSNTANRTAPLLFIENDQVTGSGNAIDIQQDQAGYSIDAALSSGGLGFKLEGGILFAERADHASTPAAGFGEIWVNSNDGPQGNRLFYTDDNGNDYDLTSLNGGNQPTGTIIAWPAATPPPGFLECDGSSVAVATYPDLFAVIGYTYGGAGANFNLPDYRGEFLRGRDNGRGADPDAGSRTNRGDGTTGDNVGTKQGDQFESHDHSASVTEPASGQGHRHLDNGTANGDSDGSSSDPGQGFLGTHFTQRATTGISVNIGNEGGSETRPRNVNVIYCIRFASTGTAGNAAGLNGSVQYNSGNDFAGDNNFLWDSVGGELTVQNFVSIRGPDPGDPSLGDPLEAAMVFKSNDNNVYGNFGYDSNDSLEMKNFAPTADLILLVADSGGNADYGMTMNSEAVAWDLDVNGSAETIMDFDTSGAVQVEEARVQIYAPVNLESSVDLLFAEKADHTVAPAAGVGQLWVRNDSPNVLVFTDDAGTDFVLNAASGIGGSIANDQVAVGAATANDIEGSSAFRWDLNQLTIEPTAGGDNFRIITDFPEILMESSGNINNLRIFGNFDDFTPTDDRAIEFSINGGTKMRLQTNDLYFERPLFINERAAARGNQAGYGQLWVNSADDSLNYTTEAGVNFDLTAGGGGGSPGGADTQIQYNNAGAFGGLPEVTWNSGSSRLELNGADLAVDNNRRIYLDGGGNTWIQEISGGDSIELYAGGFVRAQFSSSIALKPTTVLIGETTSPTDLTLFLDTDGGGRNKRINWRSAASSEGQLGYVASFDAILAQGPVQNIFSWDDDGITFYRGIYEQVDAVGASDIDLRIGTFFTKTITANTTFTFSNPPASGTLGQFTLQLTDGGAFTVTWPASVEWPGGTAPTLTASGKDIISFITTDGGTTYQGFVGGLDFQ